MGFSFPTTGVEGDRQRSVELWATPRLSVGAWNQDGSTVMPLNLSDGAQGDSLTFDFTADAGTWTFELLHETGPNRGIYTVIIDSGNVGTIDGYASFFPTDVIAFGKLVGVAIATSGAHLLALSMLTKNAGASAYYGAVSRATFTRTD